MSESLDESDITRIILEEFAEEFGKRVEVDVAVVGAGPSGMTAARYLSNDGYNVVILERKLSMGGGMWGGGMSFPVAVIQPDAKDILEENGVNLKDRGGYYIADSIEMAAKVAANTIDAGAKIFNNITVEDVLIRKDDRVKGVVINWSSVLVSGLHVDPLAIKADVVIDSSGHDAEVLNVIREKIPDSESKFQISYTGKERSMWADRGEQEVVENTREIYPGVIVSGMAANAAFRSPRMGPIFGGMFMSGRKAAEEAEKLLEQRD